MQQPDAPFQTGSASHSPFPPPTHPATPSSLASPLDAPAFPPAHAAPPATQGMRASASLSGGNTPAHSPAGSAGVGGAYAALPERDASTARGAFGAPPLSRNGSSSASLGAEAMGRAGSVNGAAARRADKGKGVARDGARAGHADEEGDADEQHRRVERVLQRAEASKLARAFRNRLALASFKTARGWQDVRLDTIEPHLEQEALRRSQGGAPADAAAMQPIPAHFAPHAHAHEQLAYAAQAQMYQQQQVPAGAYGMDAVLGGGAQAPPHPAKRARLDDPHAHNHQHTMGQPNLYSAHSVYAPPPQPAQTVSPYSTASVYQRGVGGGGFGAGPAPGAIAGPSGSAPRSPFDPQPVADAPTPRKQRAAAAASPLGSPRARRAVSRRSSPAKGGQPLSSSDPHFSSFVDAATALTGMARAPSDPSLGSGSDEGEGAAGASANGAQAAGTGAEGSGAAPAGGRAPFARPSTPERQILKLPAQQQGAPGGSGGNGNGNDSGTAEGAAELMLFLAASPSPVQSRKTVPTTLGDGSAVKGRRLFSGMGMGSGAPAQDAQDAESIFGGELGGGGGVAGGRPASSSGALDTPFATSSSTTASAAAAVEPVKAGIFGAPATPGRQRQPSLGGAGANWDMFINASPSPKRAPAGAGVGTRGVSPPHAAIEA
ncbi:hypothetical protein JCM10450v2_006686 [Rhodotorula kratochvilovae]